MNCLNLSDIVTEVFVEFILFAVRAKLIVWLKYVIAESTAETGEKQRWISNPRQRQASYGTQPEVALRLMVFNGNKRRLAHLQTHEPASPSCSHTP